jgi:hypothetical protein
VLNINPLTAEDAESAEKSVNHEGDKGKPRRHGDTEKIWRQSTVRVAEEEGKVPSVPKFPVVGLYGGLSSKMPPHSPNEVMPNRLSPCSVRLP